MKALFDQVVNTKYNELESYSKFIADVAKNRRCHVSAISNAYIKAQRHEPKDINEAKATLLHYIKCELLYTATETDKECVKTKEVYTIADEIDEVPTQLDLHSIIDNEVSSWNWIDKKFFYAYMDFRKQKKSLKDLANHYGIEYRYTLNKVTQLKKRFNGKIDN